MGKKKKEPEPSSKDRVDAFLRQLRKMRRKQRRKQQRKKDGEEKKEEE